MAETLISFRIMHQSLVPDQVTDILGVEPSMKYAHGERVSESGRTSPHGAWILDEYGVQSSDVPETIRRLIQQFEHAASWLADRRQEGYCIGVMCTASAESDEAFCLSLDSKLLGELARLSASFDLTVMP